MKIFLTGASGFIGSHLFKYIIQKPNIEVLILLRDEKKISTIFKDIPGVRYIKGDLLDINSFSDELINFDPDIFFHLGWIGVENFNRNNLLQFKNLKVTLDLIDLLPKLNLKKFIGVGSQAEYGNLDKKINEFSETKPTTNYGFCKLKSYELLSYYFLQTNITFCWVRLFSSFGPGDNSCWLIPSIINHILEGRSPELTSCDQLWDYVYIDDVIKAIISIMESNLTDGVYNLGSGNAYELKEIVKYIRDTINPKIQLGFGKVPYRGDQVMHLQADIRKLKNDTTWVPRNTLYEDLAQTINFYINEKK